MLLDDRVPFGISHEHSHALATTNIMMSIPIQCAGTMPFSPSFPPLYIPRLSSHHIPGRFPMCFGHGGSRWTSPPSNEHGVVINTERGTHDIPRHRAHVMLGEDAVIDLAGTVVIGSQWMWCCAIWDWVWSEIQSRGDERLCCWQDETIGNWLVQEPV